MKHSCTFIASPRVKELLLNLWLEYNSGGMGTRELLISLREELGKEEFSKFEKDLAWLLCRRYVRTAIQSIIEAAIRREKYTPTRKKLRTIYQPA